MDKDMVQRLLNEYSAEVMCNLPDENEETDKLYKRQRIGVIAIFAHKLDLCVPDFIAEYADDNGWSIVDCIMDFNKYLDELKKGPKDCGNCSGG